MGAYILRRLLLMIPTIIGIMAISFTVIQFAPGGPVEQVIAHLTKAGGSDRMSGSSGDLMQASSDESGRYRGAQGLDPELIAKLEKQFGFDKPPLERFATMMWNYIRFDFGRELLSSSARGGRPHHRPSCRCRSRSACGPRCWSHLPSRSRSASARRCSDGSTLRRLDLRRGRRRLRRCRASCSACCLIVTFSPAARYFAWFPLRGLASDGWSSSWLGTQQTARLSLAPDAAADLGNGRSAASRRLTHADEELVHRGARASMYVHDGAGQGADRAAACCTATSSATPC